MKSVYGFFLLVLFAQPVLADNAIVQNHTDAPIYVTGDILLKMCAADEKTTDGPDVCNGYIAGVLDTITSNSGFVQGYAICLPHPGPRLEAVRDMLMKQLHDHPEQSRAVGASIIDTMLFDTYRCPNALPPPR